MIVNGVGTTATLDGTGHDDDDDDDDVDILHFFGISSLFKQAKP